MTDFITLLDAKLDKFLKELDESQRLVFIQLYLSESAKEKIVLKIVKEATA